MNRKRSRIRRRRCVTCEQRSDRRTAEYIVRRIDQVQEDLSDLMPDLQSFQHYSEMEDLGWALRILQNLKQRYDRFAASGFWDGK